MFWGSHECPVNLHKLLHCSEPLCPRRSNSRHQVHNREKGNHVIGFALHLPAEYSTVRNYKKRPERAFPSSVSVAIGAEKRKIKPRFKFIGPLSKVNMFDLADMFFLQSASVKSIQLAVVFLLAHSLALRARFIPASVQAKSRLLNHACSKLSAPSTCHVNSGLLGKYVSF